MNHDNNLGIHDIKYSILEDKIAKSLRDAFIRAYIDTSTEYYKTYINAPSQYEKGEFYDGYLWDCLKDNDAWKHSCTMDVAYDFLRQRKEIYVMWDLFSNERVKDGRLFSEELPQQTILRTQTEEFIKQVDYEWWADWSPNKPILFPEDVYCFDEKMNWCVIFTHEADWKDCTKRICFLYTV